MMDIKQKLGAESVPRDASNFQDAFNPSYVRLERRQLLSATFMTIGTSELVLDDFDAGQNLSFSQGTTDVNLTAQDSYIFRLAAGSWSGDASHPLIEIENFAGGINNQLEVATSFFMNSPTNSQLTIDGATASGGMVEFDQTSASLQFGSLQLSNFANDNRGFTLSADGDVTLENVTVFDSDPNDSVAPAATYNVNVDGPLQFLGNNGNLIDNPSAGVTLLSQNSIVMAGDATLEANGGPVFIATVGGGDISLSSVSSGASGDAISIVAGGDVLDVRATPGNVIAAPAGRIEITAGGEIGAAGVGAINVDSQGLQFMSQGAAHFESTQKITVDANSSSLGGSMIAGEIDVLANITTGDRFEFKTIASVGVGDFLIDDGAEIRLSASSDAAIEIEAVNDIRIADGQIITSGDGQHAVAIRSTGPSGTFINGAGALPTVVTNHLEVNVGSGMGVAGMPLRTEVDQLTANVRNTGDLFLAERDGIELVQVATADGAIDVRAGGSVIATDVRAQETETVEDNSDRLVIGSASGDVRLGQVFAADGMIIDAATDIRQLPDSTIRSDAGASFVAGDSIRLASRPAEAIDIRSQAQFSANTIEIGADGFEAGDPAATNVTLGSVEFDASQVILIEDDSTRLAGNTNVDEILIVSGGDVTNAANTTLTATDVQIETNSNVVLGASNNDRISLARVGLVASNGHLEVDSDLEINGQKIETPASPTIGQPLQQQTRVEQTLYVVADGSVEQSVGELCAKRLGIRATEHVHLSSVSSFNEAIAIAAGGSQDVADAIIDSTLETLGNIPNSDVDANRDQAIAFNHQGTANVETVTSHHNSDSSSGLSSTEGSITALASQSIQIRQDITAESGILDPQVTLWSAAGDSNDPAIHFLGGQVFVSGPTNFGGVNSNQTFANFFDETGFAFEGTTRLLTLSPDGTASQDIIVEYGQPGEAGYRIGVVWDALNEAGSPRENINLFVPSVDVDSEAYNDPVYQNNTVTRHQLAGNEGGRETISKVAPFSREAIIAHTDEPNVFANITVRNDQHINLFSGDLNTLDNSLNETQQRLLLAELDAPKKATPILPTINEFDPLPVRSVDGVPLDSPTPLEQTTGLFGRQVAAFEQGELQWVQVAIPMDDLEMTGDEVVLKHPARFYPANEAAEEYGFENIGENETDRIVKQIEGSPEAEPGYWYRIFKSYENRDDELIFYYFKTGEADLSEGDASTDTPQNERRLEAAPADDATDLNPVPEDNPASENNSGMNAAPTNAAPRDVTLSDPETSALPDDGKAATSSMALLALMGFKLTKKQPKHGSSNSRCVENSADVPQKFDRRSRLLRKLRSTA